MNGLFDYILNFWPIFVGILIFYLIKSVKITGKKIKIYQNKNGSLGTEKDSDLMHNGGSPRFKELILEELIVRGKFQKNSTIDYFSKGFSEAGFVSTDNLALLPGYLDKNRKSDVTLFIREKQVLFNEILTFGRVSGILIGYSSEYRIKLERI